ncbi:MAG: 30S ribosomal protein S20 [Alphaproteobacteria bacterium]|nr:30S ribosomal protein S20 [Alphaproteobacteria bacterium]
MANIKSAKKRIRQTETRTERNRSYMNRVRTFVKRVELAIVAGDHSQARQALLAAEPELIKAGTRGIIHRNTASRKVSRLAKKVNQLRSAG